MNEKEALISLSTFVPFGPKRIDLLISFFGSAEKAWGADRFHLEKLGLNEGKISEFIKHRSTFDLADYLKKLNKNSIKVVLKSDSNYPNELKGIDSAPILLYFKGKMKKGEIGIAIVGARDASSYGKEIAERFANELALYGITVVSGLARGIDTVAHKGALSGHGRTIAILGCGLDLIYPPENKSLAEEIINHNGAIISEFPLGYPVMKTNFVSRNRIISGISKAVVVVEGRKKSGTLLTASAAAEQGRTVFAVPGPITSSNSEAPLFLIKNGAKPISNTFEILEDLWTELELDGKNIQNVFPDRKEDAKILQVLTLKPTHIDNIVRISSLESTIVSARLTIMELKGIVENMGNGEFKKS